jgi:hypothetical protein
MCVGSTENGYVCVYAVKLRRCEFTLSSLTWVEASALFDTLYFGLSTPSTPSTSWPSSVEPDPSALQKGYLLSELESILQELATEGTVEVLFVALDEPEYALFIDGASRVQASFNCLRKVVNLLSAIAETFSVTNLYAVIFPSEPSTSVLSPEAVHPYALRASAGVGVTTALVFVNIAVYLVMA